jgi:hypothetical protein
MSEQSSKGAVMVAYEDYIQLLQLAGVSKEDAIKVADAKVEGTTRIEETDLSQLDVAWLNRP